MCMQLHLTSPMQQRTQFHENLLQQCPVCAKTYHDAQCEVKAYSVKVIDADSDSLLFLLSNACSCRPVH